MPNEPYQRTIDFSPIFEKSIIENKTSFDSQIRLGNELPFFFDRLNPPRRLFKNQQFQLGVY